MLLTNTVNVKLRHCFLVDKSLAGLTFFIAVDSFVRILIFSGLAILPWLTYFCQGWQFYRDWQFSHDWRFLSDHFTRLSTMARFQHWPLEIGLCLTKSSRLLYSRFESEIIRYSPVHWRQFRARSEISAISWKVLSRQFQTDKNWPIKISRKLGGLQLLHETGERKSNTVLYYSMSTLWEWNLKIKNNK